MMLSPSCLSRPPTDWAVVSGQLAFIWSFKKVLNFSQSLFIYVDERTTVAASRQTRRVI